MTILKQSACSIAGLLLLLLLRCGLIEADDLSIRSMELSRRMFAPIIVVEYADFEGEFLVDTGATFTTVSGPKSLIENPKTNWTITTAGALTHGGARLIKQIHGVEVSAFGSPSTPTVLSFREELAKSNSTITAPHILGHREFDRLVIHFNLRLGICERTDQESIEKSATLLPIRDDETYPHAPSVAIDLPGFGSRNVIFDTGSYFFLTLKNERILQLKRAGILRNAGTLNGSSFGKLVQVRTFIIKSVEIGG